MNEWMNVRKKKKIKANVLFLCGTSIRSLSLPPFTPFKCPLGDFSIYLSWPSTYSFIVEIHDWNCAIHFDSMFGLNKMVQVVECVKAAQGNTSPFPFCHWQFECAPPHVCACALSLSQTIEITITFSLNPKHTHTLADYQIRLKHFFFYSHYLKIRCCFWMCHVASRQPWI